MFSNYRSYYNKEPEQRCMTDHRIKNNPLSSFENKQRSFSNISLRTSSLRLKINKEASQILVIWYSLHILQYMGSL
jgi:hypothetical protein